MREAERWMLDRMHYSDGLGAIYPSIMYSIMAMDRWAMSATIRIWRRPSANLTG